VSGPEGVRFQRSAEALSRRVGRAILVSTPKSDGVHELTGGAIAVWDELRTPRTLVDVVERLSFSYAERPSDIAARVVECVDSLVVLGAVEEVRDFDG
jgi:hypothetical protein